MYSVVLIWTFSAVLPEFRKKKGFMSENVVWLSYTSVTLKHIYHTGVDEVPEQSWTQYYFLFSWMFTLF